MSDDDGTDYDRVRELYLSGHEIASHSLTHRDPSTWWAHASYDDWRKEIVGMRQKLARDARIPPREVRGMRAPFLELGSDRQFLMMRDHGFLYDSSFMTGPLYENDPKLPVWPYTLDFPPKLEFCDSIACPKRNFSGIWEIPLNRWIGNDGHSCPMTDACSTQGLNTKQDVLRYLWKNFHRHYSHKTPFGMHLHTTWFQDAWKLEAVDEFVQALVDREDVYLVTMYQMIQWMKNITPLHELPDFEPWKTSCNKGRVLLSKHTTPKPKPQRTRPPRVAPTRPYGPNPTPGSRPRRPGRRPGMTFGRRTSQPSRMVTAREYSRIRITGHPISEEVERHDPVRRLTRVRKPSVEEREMSATGRSRGIANSTPSPKRRPSPTRRSHHTSRPTPSSNRVRPENDKRISSKVEVEKPESKPAHGSRSQPQPSRAPPRRPSATDSQTEPNKPSTTDTQPRRPSSSTAQQTPQSSTVRGSERSGGSELPHGSERSDGAEQTGPQAGRGLVKCDANGICVRPAGGNLRNGGASVQGRRQRVRSSATPLVYTTTKWSITLLGIVTLFIPAHII